jgi:hypothetical protein
VAPDFPADATFALTACWCVAAMRDHGPRHQFEAWQKSIHAGGRDPELCKVELLMASAAAGSFRLTYRRENCTYATSSADHPITARVPAQLKELET